MSCRGGGPDRSQHSDLRQQAVDLCDIGGVVGTAFAYGSPDHDRHFAHSLEQLLSTALHARSGGRGSVRTEVPMQFSLEPVCMFVVSPDLEVCAADDRAAPSER